MCKCINLLRRNIEQDLRNEPAMNCREIDKNNSRNWNDLPLEISVIALRLLSLKFCLWILNLFLLDYATALDNKIEDPVFQLIALWHLSFSILRFYPSFTLVLAIYSFNIRLNIVFNCDNPWRYCQPMRILIYDTH